MKLHTSKSISVGLVAAYPFQEGVGTSLADLTTFQNSTSSFTGGNGGIPVWVPGQFGHSLFFDVAGQAYAVIPDSPSMNVQTGPFSLVTWVKTIPTGNTKTIISKGRNSGTFTYILYVNATTGYPGFSLYDGTNNPGIDSTTVNVADGGWHQVVGIYDGSNLNIYIDGKFNISTSAGAYSGTTTTGTTLLGRWAFNNQYFNGDMDAVLIYNRALSAVEVQQLYYDPFCMYHVNDNRWLTSTVTPPPPSVASGNFFNFY